MLRVVLDTNVVVSGLKDSKTPPGQILQLWKNNQFTVITSPQLLAEIHEVLLRQPILSLLKQTPAIVDKFIKFLIQRTFITKGKLEIDVLKNDPDDNMVLATAIEGQASYLITGNIKHFPFKEYQGVKIVKPQEFSLLFEKITHQEFD